MEHAPAWLTNSLIYLAAAVIAVPLSRAIGLGSILGYLAAGIAIGPWGFGLVTNVEDILHFAEFGVVLMLFLIGLELEPRRLWSLRRPIFGWGSAQVLGCAALLFGVGVLAGAPWRIALVAALGLALSSTAIALQVLGERNLLPTSSGQAGFSILLFQDVAAIPILALLPLLAGAGQDAQRGSRPGWRRCKIVGVIGGIVLGGRLLCARCCAGSPEPHAGDLHRRGAAAGGGHRRADAAGGHVDGAGRLPRRRAAGGKRIPARARDRHRALQGPACWACSSSRWA
jgi:glutathione-regulated potassium-efflux system ancillary protein KefC